MEVLKRRTRASKDPSNNLQGLELQENHKNYNNSNSSSLLRNGHNDKKKEEDESSLLLNPQRRKGETFRKITVFATLILLLGIVLIGKMIDAIPQQILVVGGTTRGNIRSKDDDEEPRKGTIHKEDKQNDRHDNNHTSVLRTVPSSSPPLIPLYGKMNHALYHFEATKLGPHFANAIQYFFDEYIAERSKEVDAAALFAKQRVAMPQVVNYHRECYKPPEVQRMVALEKQKKEHVLSSNFNSNDEKLLKFLVKEHGFFYDKPAKIPKANAQTMDQIAHVTPNGKWVWRAAAVFGTQYARKISEFRSRMNALLRHDKFLAGSVSGTFWYPPNSIREWHTNAWDVQVTIDPKTRKQHLRNPWRMYYVRVNPVSNDTVVDDSDIDIDDQSGFHIVEGNGITKERLKQLGAYQLTHNTNNDNGDASPNVWRVPDKNGYMTLFRLEVNEPYRWHCIVAGETVNRYSLGMSLSDYDVEGLLEHIGVEY